MDDPGRIGRGEMRAATQGRPYEDCDPVMHDNGGQGLPCPYRLSRPEGSGVVRCGRPRRAAPTRNTIHSCMAASDKAGYVPTGCRGRKDRAWRDAGRIDLTPWPPLPQAGEGEGGDNPGWRSRKDGDWEAGRPRRAAPTQDDLYQGMARRDSDCAMRCRRQGVRARGLAPNCTGGQIVRSWAGDWIEEREAHDKPAQTWKRREKGKIAAGQPQCAEVQHPRRGRCNHRTPARGRILQGGLCLCGRTPLNCLGMAAPGHTPYRIEA